MQNHSPVILARGWTTLVAVIKTNMTDKIDPKFKELILAKIPSNRLGEPSDVANVAAFLSSEMSNYITGETIHVNGGMYLG